MSSTRNIILTKAQKGLDKNNVLTKLQRTKSKNGLDHKKT